MGCISRTQIGAAAPLTCSIREGKFVLIGPKKEKLLGFALSPQLIQFVSLLLSNASSRFLAMYYRNPFAVMLQRGGTSILQLLAGDKVSNWEEMDCPTKHFYFLN